MGDDKTPATTAWIRFTGYVLDPTWQVTIRVGTHCSLTPPVVTINARSEVKRRARLFLSLSFSLSRSSPSRIISGAASRLSLTVRPELSADPKKNAPPRAVGRQLSS